MNETLMEIVEKCQPQEKVEPVDVTAAFRTADHLRKAGFTRAALAVLERAEVRQKLARISTFKYIAITRDEIEGFLAKRNSLEMPVPWKRWVSTGDREIALDRETYFWHQTNVSAYLGVPPHRIIEALEAHRERGCFDEFVVGEVVRVKDPLLLGTINGVTDRLWFIAQWGEDVALDDVIK